MSGIAEAITGMAHGGGKGAHGISSHMERGSEHHEDGKGEEHGDAAEYLKEMHAKHGGKHMHVHQHEGGITTHQIGEDGKVEGPHEHENTEALKDHMDRFLNEEEHEAPEHESHDGLI